MVGHQHVEENPDGTFAEMLMHRELARKSFHAYDNSRSLRRLALQPGRRKPVAVERGDVGYYYRLKGGPQGPRTGPRDGLWLGPAWILAYTQEHPCPLRPGTVPRSNNIRARGVEADDGLPS